MLTYKHSPSNVGFNRWTVHGIPRVPWEAEGTFDGISTYRLDASGKVYEHVVDNVLLRDPPMLANPLLAGLNLAPLQPQTPQLGKDRGVCGWVAAALLHLAVWALSNMFWGNAVH